MENTLEFFIEQINKPSLDTLEDAYNIYNGENKDIIIGVLAREIIDLKETVRHLSNVVETLKDKQGKF